MVKKFFTFFTQEVHGLHEAAYLLGIFAILSQLLGLVRDRLLASYFGAGHVVDMYYAAFRVPDFIFVAIASIVSFAVLVPFIVERMEKGKEETKNFISSIFSFFFLLMIVAGGVAYFLLPRLVPYLYPGFDSASVHEVVLLSRILLLSPFFLGLSNFLASITQVKRKFYIYAISPLFYNLGIIVGIIFFYPHLGIEGVVWGVVLGAVMHMLLQVQPAYSAGLMPRFAPIRFSEVGKVLTLSIPRTLTLGMNQLETLVLVGFASVLAVGSIGVFNFSWNLQSVVLSTIGASYATAAFPTLSRLFNAGKKSDFVAQVVTSGRHIVFWSMPLSVLFIVLRAQIVRTVLGGGAFTWAATRLTAATLALFVVSVVAQGLTLLFIRAQYAVGRTRQPLVASLIGGLITIGLTPLFLYWFGHSFSFQYFIESLFRVTDIPGTAVLMLPLAFTISGLIELVILWMQFSKDYPDISKPILATIFESFAASVIMGFVAYLGLNLFSTIFDQNTLIGIFLQGLSAGVLGIIAGILIFILLKNQEIAEIWKTLHSKIWKAKPIAVEQSEL